MKTIVQLSLALLTALTINGCGGGGGSSSDKNSSGNSTNVTNPNNNATNTTQPDNNSTNTTQPETNTTNPETNTCVDGGKIKHGHQLPPCPDPIKNDETLLGIDSNNNGVRDDVEIWIYNTYDTYKICRQEKYTIIVDGTRTSTGKPIISNGTRRVCDGETQPFHQIVREVAMQHARAFQIVIQEPEKARETVNIMHAALDCGFYFKRWAHLDGDPLLIPYGYDVNLQDIQINTKQRALAYMIYNRKLGGGVYSGPDGSYKRFCDFDVDKMLKE